MMPDLLRSETAAGPVTPGSPKAQTSAIDPYILAALLSAALPGVGHFLQKRWRKGFFLLLMFAALFSIYWPLRLPDGVADAQIAMLAAIGLAVFAVWDVAYSGKSLDTRPSAWWLALLLPFAAYAGAWRSGQELKLAGFQGYSVPSSSMAPTIPLGSILMIDHWYYHTRSPQRGDVIACNQPRQPNVTVIKRVIAVGGEKIEVRGDRVLINGESLTEPYILLSGPVLDEFQHVGPMEIPAGQLFVMGDNRHQSLDSRMMDMFGLVNLASVRGRVIYVQPSYLSKGKRLD